MMCIMSEAIGRMDPWRQAGSAEARRWPSEILRPHSWSGQVLPCTQAQKVPLDAILSGNDYINNGPEEASSLPPDTFHLTYGDVASCLFKCQTVELSQYSPCVAWATEAPLEFRDSLIDLGGD